MLARVLPFFIFLALTFGQELFGGAAPYWFYLGKTVAGAWMLWAIRAQVTEMRWTLSLDAVVAGIAVFLLWVGLDGLYPPLDVLLHKVGLGKAASAGTIWNPNVAFEGSALAIFFIGVRLIGSALVVPPLEEVFYRSFLYRWIIDPQFERVPLGAFHWKSFLFTSVIFGMEHREWLAGILCGFIYQGLVCRRKRLGDAITAHAITNLLLGIWVVWKGAWHFW